MATAAPAPTPPDPPPGSQLRCDIDLRADGKATGFVRLPHSVHRSAYGWIPIPIVRIANGPGPRVLMVAGNHGDEWEGQIALGRLIQSLTPSQIRGQLVILPSANFPAAMAGQRTSPIDAGNLNRTFPGDPAGSVTAQIAWWIEHVLLPGFDYSFDFHSGGNSLVYLPSTLAYRDRDPARMARVLGLVRAFAAPVAYIVDAPQSGGRSFTAASIRQGVMSIATEVGGGGYVTPASMDMMEGGMRRLLAHVGLLQDAPTDTAGAPTTTTRLTEVAGDDYYVYATDSGLFEPLVEIGSQVQRDQPAARIHFHHTPWREPLLLRFQRDGLVLCKRGPAPCERGDCLFQLATDLPMA
ncbi:MAG: succinylglutamate desuccinylase/aspartoacylase family protein [Rhodoferax sp.]|jgi:predicted deacylase|nr:succinylglutamate desuccinylase/aspartoacylase family protein [Rhodoferax sp.]